MELAKTTGIKKSPKIKGNLQIKSENNNVWKQRSIYSIL